MVRNQIHLLDGTLLLDREVMDMGGGFFSFTQSSSQMARPDGESSMNELIGITPQEAARRACDLNISGRVESLVELVRWAQNAILSAHGPAVEIRVIEETK